MARISVILRVVPSSRERIDMHGPGTIKAAFPIDDTGDRVVLLYWGLSSEARLRNVARVDPAGRVLWRAELPGNAARDCFVALERCGSLFEARTYSGGRVTFDADGKTLERPRLEPAL